MSRFNTPAARSAPGTSPVTTSAVPAGRTHQGGDGYARDAKSELFLLAVAHLGDNSFYETGRARDTRLTSLVTQIAAADPAWVSGFVPWLRGTANMRTASVTVAADAAHAMLLAGVPGSRAIISAALQRADEPGELLAYWHAQYGRNEPKAVKRGITDAIMRLYTEYTLLKYDTGAHGYRFGDVIERVHVTGEHSEAKGTWHGDLFEHAIDRRHNRGNDVPARLVMLRANAALRRAASADPSVLLDIGALRAAGMTWEDALSLAGGRVPKDKLWAALIPSMSYMGLLRNLRNLDDAGVPDTITQAVADRLADPAYVQRSRQFPFRFLAAYNAVRGLRWAYPLEKAITASLAAVPALPGRTLILVDRSGSMFDRVSEKSGLNRADTAAIFGAALAIRAEYADLVQFGTSSAPVDFRHADSILRVVDRFGNLGGTDTTSAVRRHFRQGFHNRVAIITDEQSAYGSPLSHVPADVPCYTWNLAGYRLGHGESGVRFRHTFGGLTDAAFGMIPMLENGQNADWDTLFRTAPAAAGAEAA